MLYIHIKCVIYNIIIAADPCTFSIIRGTCSRVSIVYKITTVFGFFFRFYRKIDTYVFGCTYNNIMFIFLCAMIFTILFLQMISIMSRVVGDSNGYYCTGTKSGNIHFKCIKTPCNGTLCETIIDYLNEPGPNIIINANNKVLLNLEIENISTIHVSCTYTTINITHTYYVFTSITYLLIREDNLNR